MNKQQITKNLHAIGASWAVTDQRRNGSYTVHPYRADPQENAILYFYSLKELANWIDVKREAGELTRATETTYGVAFDGDTWYVTDMGF